ncbi:MAG: carbohydrate ABC transporter permease, partial [Pseudomonadota bacterium]
MAVSDVGTFLTRTAGGSNKASRFGTTDVLAYSYLVFGVLIVLIPVLWTFMSSIKPEEAIDSFDTRVLPYDQIETEVPGVGLKSVWVWEKEDGTSQEVFKAGPTRSMTDVAPIDDPEAVEQAPRRQLRMAEELRVATENYLDPILKRNGQDSFNFFTYFYNSTFVT